MKETLMLADLLEYLRLERYLRYWVHFSNSVIRFYYFTHEFIRTLFIVIAYFRLLSDTVVQVFYC